MDSMERQRIVILGAGFGGLTCARALAGRPVDVVLVDRNNYHLFTPLLYQVASSLLNPSDIARPIRSMFRHVRNVRCVMAEVESIDFGGRALQTSDGRELAWDRLVLALGSVTNFFGMERVRQKSFQLKDLPDALQLRGHVLRCFELASHEQDAQVKQKWLTFVIVGGGPTGVEYAGALSELIRRVLSRDYPEVELGLVRILLLEGDPRLLGQFPPEASEYTVARLARLGVKPMLGAKVVDASEGAVVLAGGEELAAGTLLWAAGVGPAPLAARLPLPRTRQGRIEVDEFLRVQGREDVYAIGDIAAFRQDGSELPMMAPPAMQAARHVARAIVRSAQGRPPIPFRYKSPGVMAVIGRNAAVAIVGKWRFVGFLGWTAWLVLHVYYLIGFRNRIAVLAGWAWNYVFYDRPVRLIVGDPVDAADAAVRQEDTVAGEPRRG
jgi:NADH dehydrogenase